MKSRNGRWVFHRQNDVISIRTPYFDVLICTWEPSAQLSIFLNYWRMLVFAARWQAERPGVIWSLPLPFGWAAIWRYHWGNMPETSQ